MFADVAFSGGDVPLSRGIEDRNESFCDHVVDFLLVVVQARRWLVGRNYGEVIADLLVVENPFVVSIDPIVVQRFLGKRF